MEFLAGIVFDLDDTLYPQIEYKRSGFRVVAEWAAAHVGVDCSSCVDELEKILAEKGPSYHYMFNDLVSKFGLNKKHVPAMVEIFRAHEPRIACYPKVLETLEYLREDLRTGILTDGPWEVQQRKVAALGLEERVDVILYSDALGMEKPEPALFEWFESKFNLCGYELAYAGDNPRKDFVGARSRGWTTIRVLTGEHVNEEAVPGHEADIVVKSPAELEALVPREEMV